MSTLLYALGAGPVPANQKVVRSTTEYVEQDARPAVASDPPDWNEKETDPNPNLGLENRQVASFWVEREKYAPSWAGEATSITDDQASLNRRQAVQGTAASREMQGMFGHGTVAYAIGIEPYIRDNAAFGTDYFAATERGIQEDVRQYLNPPPGQDRDAISATAGAAKDSARDASSAGLYQSWYAAAIGAH